MEPPKGTPLGGSRQTMSSRALCLKRDDRIDEMTLYRTDGDCRVVDIMLVTRLKVLTNNSASLSRR